MLYGCLDAITSSRYVEGWAYDDTALLHPLTVSVLANRQPLAHGLANLYRPDLIDAGHGTGWCAFRLRFSESPDDVGEQTLSLWDMSSQREICRNVATRRSENGEKVLSTLEDVVLSDPTVVFSIEQLRGCEGVFARFIEAEGIDTFVRYAYIYTLGRPAHAFAHRSDCMHLHAGSLTPYELLCKLCESEEFRSSSRLLIAPSQPSFVFRR